MKQEPTAPRPHRLAPPPIPGLDTTSPNVGYTGEITNGTLPEDWPIFAEIYVPFLAKYPLVQNLLGYRIDQHVLRYGDPPLNPRFNVFTHRHYEVLWLLVFPCRDVASDAEPPHALCAWPSEFTRKDARKRLRHYRQLEPEALHDIVEVATGRWVIYSSAVTWFLLEHCLNDWRSLVDAFNAYYEGTITPIDVEQPADLLKIAQAFVRALADTHPLERLAYAQQDQSGRDPLHLLGPDWKLDVLKRFKVYLWRAFGQPMADLGALGDRQFAHAFEACWSRALCFPDHGYGFAVIPAFTLEDMARYAALAKPHRRTRIVWEMIDWVVFKICPSLAVSIDRLEPTRYQQWVDLLIKLTAPLAESLANRVQKVHVKLSKGEVNPQDVSLIIEQIRHDIVTFATEQFQHLFHRMAAFIGGEIPGFLPTGLLLATRLQGQNDPALRHNPWIRWLRPSYVIARMLKTKYALGHRTDPRGDETATDQVMPANDAEEHPDERARRHALQSSRHQHRKNSALSPQEETAIDREAAETALAEAADVRDSVIVEGTRYLTITGLARRVGRCEKTLRNMERHGELVFEWKAPPNGRKPIRLFPDDAQAIDELRLLCDPAFTDWTVAKLLGISDRQLRNRKHALGIANLPKIEQKRRLIGLIRAHSIQS